MRSFEKMAYLRSETNLTTNLEANKTYMFLYLSIDLYSKATTASLMLDEEVRCQSLAISLIYFTQV